MDDFPKIVDSPTVLLFIGSERTGSTMLGQIINHHPACLVANESRFLARVLEGEAPFETLLAHVATDAWDQFLVGLECTERFRATVGGDLQRRWRSFQEVVSDWPKRTVTVVGDKKAGANTQAVLDHPEACTRLVRERSAIRLLQIVRDPKDAAASSARDLGRSLDEAFEQIVRRTRAAHAWARQFGDRSMHVYYEDLCREPAREIDRILKWLGLEVDSAWLEAVSRCVTPVEDVRPLSEVGAELDVLHRYPGRTV